jgi:hypothetical protein
VQLECANLFACNFGALSDLCAKFDLSVMIFVKINEMSLKTFHFISKMTTTITYDLSTIPDFITDMENNNVNNKFYTIRNKFIF